MKKKIAIAAIIASIGLAGFSQAYAWGPRGGGNNYGNSPQYQGTQYNQVDPAAQEKIDKFFTGTQELRKEIAMKRAEKQAMIRGENPDPAALSKVTGELFDLQATMRQKADEAGVSEYRGRMGGHDFGPGMRGGQNKGGRFMNSNMNFPGNRGANDFGPGMRGGQSKGGRFMNNNMNYPGYRGGGS